MPLWRPYYITLHMHARVIRVIVQTEEEVLKLFRSKGATAVTRYELPKLPALNFVIEDVLEGGVNESLNLDGHGKALSYLLLELTIEMPEAI